MLNDNKSISSISSGRKSRKHRISSDDHEVNRDDESFKIVQTDQLDPEDIETSISKNDANAQRIDL